MGSRPTIEDVAALAGVSTATVSRTLHDPEIVSEKARRNVDDAIRQTGYTQNAAAQNLRQQRARAVLVLVPDIGNNYFPEVLSGIERVASQAGLTVLIGDTTFEEKREENFLRYLSNGRADGALLLTGSLPKAQHFFGAAIVSVSERIPGHDLSHVGMDNVAAAKAATQHLIDIGHKHIGHLRGPEHSVLTKERMEGFQAATLAAGLHQSADFILDGDFTAESGERAADTLMKMEIRPTAIFCSNDEMAMRLISRLHGCGLSVPNDLSVVGFDDIRFARTYIPALTTIHQPRKRIGEKAMSCLLDMLSAPLPPQPKSFILDWELIVRDSTAPFRS